jgi:hypothetical protein
MKIGRVNLSTRRKPAPAPLCPPQIPLDETRDQTRAAAVGRQRLTAWAMARPFQFPTMDYSQCSQQAMMHAGVQPSQHKPLLLFYIQLRSHPYSLSSCDSFLADFPYIKKIKGMWTHLAVCVSPFPNFLGFWGLWDHLAVCVFPPNCWKQE